MKKWRGEFDGFLLILLASGLVGFLFDRTAFFIAGSLFIYSVHNIYQLKRLSEWASEEQTIDETSPPEGSGNWGTIFDSIYNLQKKQRSSSNYLKSLINKAQESSAALEMAVVMINEQGNLDWGNLASERLLGFKFPDDQNQAVTNLIRDPRFTAYFYGENYTETLRISIEGISNNVLEFQITFFGKNERLMLVRDVSQLHKLESMRKDFVGNVSHELGTPITVIKGYLENIIDNLDEVDAKWHSAILQMEHQSNRMEAIVKDLLLLSTLETRAIPDDEVPTDVPTLFREVEETTLKIMTDYKHRFSTNSPSQLKLRGSYKELYSAILNLVVNAAKYSGMNNTIQLSAIIGDDAVFIEVADDGMGIEREHLSRLTERFYRVDSSRSSETGGTGLGLAIVKHILARHDGELNIQSRIGKGSRFSCKLPLHRAFSST
ncbi:phosphate regulon sensor histidine kinase PhoR [Gammaproteobacteria bacterium]|nr:phosphate regulon sensor histidine kinase PhoR [Gammaproteobacteria bacterium]